VKLYGLIGCRQAVPEKIILKHPDGSWPNIKDIDDDEVVLPVKKSRRKSWHAIKFEKQKRRKSELEDQFGSPPQARREKRGSWWNIFTGAPRYFLNAV